MSAAEKTLRTEVFRRQHREILDVVRQLEAKLVVAVSEPNVTADLRGHLNELAGKLTVHLAMEDNALYPRAMERGSPRLRKLAAEFMSEMGGIQELFREYLARWSDSQRIEENTGEFLRETTSFLEALKRRIAKEDAELYSIVDGED
jgi:hemerythrin-like domain-containing protein